MTSEVNNAGAAVDAILSARDLGKRLALAIAHLERRWDKLPGDLKRQTNPSQASAFDDSRQLPDRFDDIDGLMLGWLRDRSDDPSDELLFDFLRLTDALLVPYGDKRMCDTMAGSYEVSEEETIHLWIARRGIMEALLHDDKRRFVVRQYEDFEPRLGDRLAVVRHVRILQDDRAVRIKSPRHDVQKDFDDLWSEDAFIGPLRVGLVSLRGSFKPKLAYTRDLGDYTGFRAEEVEPQELYTARVRDMVQKAAEHGVQLLILPEFMVTSKGLEALQDALRDEGEAGHTPPLLTFAGSSHQQHEVCSMFGNCCVVLDRRGREVWRQWKRIPFGTEGEAGQLRHVIEGLPANAARVLQLVEDIEAHSDYVVQRTPIGSFSVAICADVLVRGRGTPMYLWTDAPVDWVVIPSYTLSTKRFLAAAQELNSTRKMVLFVNAYPATTVSPRRPASAGWEVIPRAKTPGDDQPVFSGFVSTPWSEPVLTWFDDEAKREAKLGVWWYADEGNEWDGLVVDLASFLQFGGVVDA